MRRRGALPAFGMVCLAVLAGAPAAMAGDRWEEAGSGAVAILPVPGKAAAITGGSLVCAEQRWSLRLRLDRSVEALSSQQAKVSVDGESFLVLAETGPDVLSLPASYEMIDAMKAGGLLVVAAGARTDGPAATFPLKNSRTVIEAIAPRCSQVDMSAYEQASLSETDPAVERARPLLAEETKLFRQATTATPKLAAAHLDRGQGREMLFATLCGSSWYYGRTGCTLFGYIRATPAEEWREAYNSEGMALYIDASASSGGWPNLVTLEAAGGAEPIQWKWNGERYELRDPLVAADEPANTGTVTP
ncbi:hypothetical protein RB623_08380 [Mesorhizobium sp. LHD-90]|uniref:hypothetical protein n=1 Tax=Mesorhizobium sp. LHD-90 TaxID=3071414 RepID=UPI0027E04AEF|nr:hypothetical protein [Mesorhizobium sp. LHD-90]MDQ6434062.1 hypothetical protein [Mesorhizobium sp. LHD-90]